MQYLRRNALMGAIFRSLGNRCIVKPTVNRFKRPWRLRVWNSQYCLSPLLPTPFVTPNSLTRDFHVELNMMAAIFISIERRDHQTPSLFYPSAAR